jgi:DNA-binding LytR/AlgR family response regulator
MPEKIQVMIVEDEAIVAADLSEQLEMEGYNVAGIADNYNDALQLFSNKPVDILLMDINIRGTKDGVETAAELIKIKTVPLIYITAFSDTATIERVKHTHPAAFLVKPYEFENVRIAIDLALHNFADTNSAKTSTEPATAADKHLDKTLFFQLGDHLFIKQNYKFFKFSVAEIVFAETDNNYVMLQTRTQKFVVRLSLGELLERINYPSFIRIHRSFAVNLNEIVYFDEQTVKIGQREFPLGRNYRQGFLDNFNPR